jgi:N-acetylmuramoyl-L-alanine amidase
MAIKIYLSPSSQPENTYAAGNTNEQAQCRRIADACEAALVRHGFEVINDQQRPWRERVVNSNKVHADLHVPIHTNACNGKVSGTRIFYYSETSAGKKAALDIFNRLAPITPGTSESVKCNPNLYELSATSAPAVYVECDFHDVPDVATWIINHVKEIGEAIAHGICDYYHVEWKAKPEYLYRRFHPSQTPQRSQSQRSTKMQAVPESIFASYRIPPLSAQKQINLNGIIIRELFSSVNKSLLRQIDRRLYLFNSLFLLLG